MGNSALDCQVPFFCYIHTKDWRVRIVMVLVLTIDCRFPYRVKEVYRLEEMEKIFVRYGRFYYEDP